MIVNITTDKQNFLYAKEFQSDLEDLFEIIRNQLNEYLRQNKDVTFLDIQNFIDGIFNGTQELI